MKRISKIIISFLFFSLLIAFFFYFSWKEINLVQKPPLVSLDLIEDEKGLGYRGQRKIVLDKKGHIYAAYRKDYSKHSEIFVAKLIQKNGSFQLSGTEKPIAIIGKNNDQRVPSIAIDSKDTIHVVWYGSDIENENNNRQIKYTRSSDEGKTWSSWRNIAFVSGYDKKELYWQEHPSLAVGKNNDLYVTWEGKDEKNRHQQIKFIRSENGGNSWTSWKNIGPSPESAQSRPSLLEDSSGKIYVFMYSSFSSSVPKNDQDFPKIQFSLSEDRGGTWSSWQIISDPALDSRHLSSAIDSKDTIHLVWRSTDPQNIFFSRIYYLSMKNGQWKKAAALFPSAHFQFFPSIGIAGPKNKEVVLASWLENETSSNLPREDPQGGTVFYSLIENGETKKIKPLNEKKNNLYPSLPENSSLSHFVPIVFSQKLGERKFQIHVDFLGLNEENKK